MWLITRCNLSSWDFSRPSSPVFWASSKTESSSCSNTQSSFGAQLSLPPFSLLCSSVGHFHLMQLIKNSNDLTLLNVPGIVMILVILASRKFKLNPDNIATPVAASLGDLITISILSSTSCLYLKNADSLLWLEVGFICFMILVVPVWAYFCYQNESVREVLTEGWTPILLAMVISSFGGLILDEAQKDFKSFAAFSPIICGIGGNLVAIQASRICTYLHANCARGKLMFYQLGQDGNLFETNRQQTWSDVNKRLKSAFNVFNNPHARSALVLLLLVIPGNIFFVFLQSLASSLFLPVVFYVAFCLASFLQVLSLLVITDWLVHVLWKMGDDPDNCSIPYLTATSDLLGTSFLLMAYLALTKLNYTV